MKEFKLIVAGGRDYANYEHMSRVLFAMADVEFADKEISIVSGMARGADALGAAFARTNHVKLYAMPANWDKYSKRAGFIRNQDMGNFADGLLAAAEAGATAIIQPGGSMRDDEVIAAADAAGLAMVFTDQRHFRH